jgi:type VI secretion system secreted protein VgrG
LNGALTLDAQGNPNALFVFQIGSRLTTASASSVNVIHGGPGTQVYWLTGSGATLGSSTVFAGNILAYSDISLGSTAEILCGRAFSETASVTLIGDNISNNNSAQNFGSGRSDFGSYGFSGGSAATVPEPSTMLLLGAGLAGLVVYRKRFNKA